MFAVYQQLICSLVGMNELSFHLPFRENKSQPLSIDQLQAQKHSTHSILPPGCMGFCFHYCFYHSLLLNFYASGSVSFCVGYHEYHLKNWVFEFFMFSCSGLTDFINHAQFSTINTFTGFNWNKIFRSSVTFLGPKFGFQIISYLWQLWEIIHSLKFKFVKT